MNANLFGLVAPTRPTATPDHDPSARNLGVPLDALLVDTASGSLHRFLPGAETAAFGASLATKPFSVVGEAANLANELGRVVLGTSTHEPSTRDRRFADPGWHDNPFLHRAVQTYLAAGESLHRLLEVAELDQRNELRMRFLADNLYDAAAPSNLPWLNPAALKEVVNTGGANIVRGLRNLVGDMAVAPRVPSMVAKEEFSVGEDLAVTPGAVVLRTPVFELIQYTPTTSEVSTTPLLLVPPTINKFYVLDLAPGRSLVEHLLASGQQVFVMSWRNPGVRRGGLGARHVRRGRAPGARQPPGRSARPSRRCSSAAAREGSSRRWRRHTSPAPVARRSLPASPSPSPSSTSPTPGWREP